MDTEGISQNELINHTIGLRKIAMKCKPKPGQEWAIIAYVISEEVVDGFHGLWFLVGTYSSREETVKEAKELIRETGIQSIHAIKTCTWGKIDETTKYDRTIFVKDERDDVDKKLRKIQKDEQNKLRRKYEDNKIIKEEMEETIKLEQEEDSIEHYTRKWFLAVKQYEKLEYLHDEVIKAQDIYQKMIYNIKELNNKYEKHKDNWIPNLAKNLRKKGEENLLDIIIDRYNIINKEI